MTIFTITTNLSSIQGNLLTNTTLLENHYNDYYFGVMQIEPPFEENEEESKESKFWNDLYENEYNTINPVVCIGSRISAVSYTHLPAIWYGGISGKRYEPRNHSATISGHAEGAILPYPY